MTANNPLAVRVVLADDHPLVREGLKRVLDRAGDIAVMAEAGDGHALLQALQAHAVQVAVVDLSMPGLSGMDLIRRVKAEHSHVGVLVLTMHAEEQYALRAFKAGANGYLTKDSAAEDLVPAIRKIARGGGYITPSLAERLAISLNGLHEEPPHTYLTDREFEVMRRLVRSERSTDIAEALHLSVKTISSHKSHILEKMHCNSVAALVRYSLEHRVFDDQDVPSASS